MQHLALQWGFAPLSHFPIIIFSISHVELWLKVAHILQPLKSKSLPKSLAYVILFLHNLRDISTVSILKICQRIKKKKKMLETKPNLKLYIYFLRWAHFPSDCRYNRALYFCCICTHIYQYICEYCIRNDRYIIAVLVCLN